MANFELAFRITMGHEDTVPSGKVETDNNGFAVKYGINKQFYPNVDFDTLDKNAVRTIYRAIWNELHVDAINNDWIAAKIFDLAFNSGVVPAVRLLQKACNVLGSTLDVDGHCGPVTIAAANSYSPIAVMAQIQDNGKEHYHDIVLAHPQWKDNEKGWDIRLASYSNVNQDPGPTLAALAHNAS